MGEGGNDTAVINDCGYWQAHAGGFYSSFLLRSETLAHVASRRVKFLRRKPRSHNMAK